MRLADTPAHTQTKSQTQVRHTTAWTKLFISFISSSQKLQDTVTHAWKIKQILGHFTSSDWAVCLTDRELDLLVVWKNLDY